MVATSLTAFVAAAPALVKVLGSLALILAVKLRLRRLGPSLVVGTVVLALWSGHRPATVGRIAWGMASSKSHCLLLAVTFLVVWLSSQMAKAGTMRELAETVRRGLAKRWAVAVLPALIGRSQPEWKRRLAADSMSPAGTFDLWPFLRQSMPGVGSGDAGGTPAPQASAAVRRHGTAATRSAISGETPLPLPSARMQHPPKGGRPPLVPWVPYVGHWGCRTEPQGDPETRAGNRPGGHLQN